MVAKKTKRGTKKLKTMPAKSLTVRQAKGVKGGAAKTKEKWI